MWKTRKVGDKGKCESQGRWWEMKGSVKVKEDGWEMKGSVEVK